MNPNAKFERDLNEWLQTEAPGSAPAGFHASVMDRARTLRQRPGWTRTFPARRFGRGRGLTLLAAAALLLVGGAMAAGSGILRLPSVIPPGPEPSGVAVATASPNATFASPSDSAAPSASSIPVAGPGGVWIAVGTMGTPRNDHAAVRLLDGRVLVVGGDPTGAAAELYDPNSGTWSATKNMIRPRDGFPATLLADGKVLVGDEGDALAGAEVYDPETGTWTATGRMVVGGGGLSTATLLRDGRVLLVGANVGAALYDPDTGAWTATGRMVNPRHAHASILLPDGRVLVVGGHYPADDPTALAELYDPLTDSWTATAGMHAEREVIAAFLQPDGRVLVVGGPGGGSKSVELYDPATETWTATGALSSGIGGGTFTSLADGSVLMTSGGDQADAAEVYDPGTGTWTTVRPMLVPHRAPATLLHDGTVLVAGGGECNNDGVCVPKGAAELYVPAGVPLPPLPAFPSPSSPVFPSPTPRPTPLPPAEGPVPPNARSWTVTVDNQSSEPATLFVADESQDGTLRLVGSATPNVVPARATVKVTFLFPLDGGWIYVNPRPGDGGGLVNADQIGIPGKILVRAEGDAGWLSP